MLPLSYTRVLRWYNETARYSVHNAEHRHFPIGNHHHTAKGRIIFNTLVLKSASATLNGTPWSSKSLKNSRDRHGVTPRDNAPLETVYSCKWILRKVIYMTFAASLQQFSLRFCIFFSKLSILQTLYSIIWIVDNIGAVTA